MTQESSRVSLLRFRELARSDNEAVRDLILGILNHEYAMGLTLPELPDLIDPHASYRDSGRGNFWVAEWEGRILGCIGVWQLSGSDYELRRMYVEACARGRGIAQSLLGLVFDWCHAHAVSALWLETNEFWKAAHHIYEKSGFVAVPRERLPATFPVVRIATGFYRRALGTEHAA